MSTLVDESPAAQDVWRALSSPVRRHLLDLLAEGPRTTGDLAEGTPELSRYAVMQHLGVLVESGLVLSRRRGRYRFNHLNPVPLAEWYRRWVTPLADQVGSEVLSLKRHVERDRTRDGGSMVVKTDDIRVVRIESELRFDASPERVFAALTEESLEWFPHSYGEERTRAVVVEPRVGGAHYEDWGGGKGYLYGLVTVFDPPAMLATRGRLTPGTIVDSEYSITPSGGGAVLRLTRVAVGPMTGEEAAGFEKFGDIAHFEEALRDVVESR